MCCQQLASVYVQNISDNTHTEGMSLSFESVDLPSTSVLSRSPILDIIAEVVELVHVKLVQGCAVVQYLVKTSLELVCCQVSPDEDIQRGC